MKESLNEQNRIDLTNYRLERAEESLQEARILVEQAHFNAAINRLYYACFYAASASMARLTQKQS